MVGGYVYILINPCMPGLEPIPKPSKHHQFDENRHDRRWFWDRLLVKIGHSTRPSEERARELSQVTGVPVPFAVAYEEEFGLYFREAEQEVHARLERHRCNQNREFFSLPLKDAIRVLAEVARAFRKQEEAEQRRDQMHPEDSSLWGRTEPGDEPPFRLVDNEPGDEPPFRLVDRQTIICSFCAESYTVTFRRYEDRSCCPRCHRIHKIDIKW